MMSGIVPQFHHAIDTALLLSMEYVDLSKWAAAIENGPHFGINVILLLILFNCIGIFCQVLSNCVGIVTRKNLAQIYSEEYCRTTCALLGTVVLLSIIVSDVSMILGVAHGFSILFGLNQLNSILFAAVFAILVPCLFTLLSSSKLELNYSSISSFAFLLYIVGILVGQPDLPSITHDRFSGYHLVTTFSFMALLGSTIMPHNFYIHPCTAQHQMKPINDMISVIIRHTFVSILFNFTGIFLANYVLISSSAAAFDNGDLIMPLPQDALLLLDQIFKSPEAPCPFFLLFLISSIIRGVTRDLGRQVILHDFFCIRPPIWVHHSIVKALAAIPALYCLLFINLEGIYQLLLLSEIIAAILLPPLVIPVFRVSLSRSIMGFFKVSGFTETFALCGLLMMLALNVSFIFEVLFGNNHWISELSGNMESGVILPYFPFLLLLLSFMSLSFALYLAFSPLKSTSNELKIKIYAWNLHAELSRHREEIPLHLIMYDDQEWSNEVTHKKAIEVQLCDEFLEFNHDQPKKDVPSEYEVPGSSTLQSSRVDVDKVFNENKSESTVDGMYIDVINKVLAVEMVKMGVSEKNKSEFSPEKNVEVEGPANPEESVPSIVSTANTTGAMNIDRLKGEILGNEDSKTGLSRLSRVGRRQLAAILDEFWANLFDFHGHLTEKAKIIRTDILLNMDLNVLYTPVRAENKRNGTSQRSSVNEESGSALPATARNNGAPREKFSTLEPHYVTIGTPGWLADTLLKFYQPCVQCDGQEHQIPMSRDFEIPTYRKWIGADETYQNYFSKFSVLDEGQFISTSNEIGSQNLAAKVSSHCEGAHSGTSPAESSSTSGYRKNNHRFPSASELRDIIVLSFFKDGSGHINNPSVSCFHGLKHGQSICLNIGAEEVMLTTNELSQAKDKKNFLSETVSSVFYSKTLWTKQPLERAFCATDETEYSGIFGPPYAPKVIFSFRESEDMVLQSLRICIRKILIVEGSGWLFIQNGGYDEVLIHQVATRENYLQKEGVGTVNQRFNNYKRCGINFFSSVPDCGYDCSWQTDLVVSFGVWCIHRIMELLLVEGRPELWGKYTFVLNRLQGILGSAFSKPRRLLKPCQCLFNPAVDRSQHVKEGPEGIERTTASLVLQMTKKVEAAILARKGPMGTGGLPFAKGKENLLSVLKRYKRRLSKISSGANAGRASSFS